ncbi:MAG: TolC family protein [Candidatus Omnitrophota bacterium]
MRKTMLCITAVTVCVFFSFIPARAEDAPGNPVLQIGLDEAIKRALAASEELKIKDSEVAKTRGKYREERSALLPQVTAQSTWTRNMAYPDTAEKTDYELSSGISASQVLWSFGRVMYAVSSAGRAVEASRFNREAGRQDIIYTAKLCYYSSLLSKNSLSITEKSYANALENKSLMGQRSNGGRSSRYEIVRMNAEVAARVPTVNEARTQFDSAAEALKKLIDADPGCTISLTGNFRDNYDEFSYDKLVAALYKQEPTLKSLEKSIEAADAKLKSRYAGFLPTVSAFTSWNYNGGSNEDESVNRSNLDRYSFAGVKVSIPVWEGGEKEALLSQSKADKEIAVLKSRQTEKAFLLELKKAFLEYEQYKDNLKANIEAVDLSEESFKQTQEMFASGQVTLTDLNDAELLLTNQRLNKEMTLFNINITQAKIEKLIAGQYDEQADEKKS